MLTKFIHTNNLSVVIVREVDTSATFHLTALSKHLSSYFPDVNTNAREWVRDPFAPAITSDILIRQKRSCWPEGKVPHADFWPSLSHEYELTVKAMRILLPFSTTYPLFFTLAAKKTKCRALLNVENDFSVCH